MPPPEQVSGEFALIDRYFRNLDTGPDTVLGNGDDAAVLRLAAGEELVVSVDTVVENVHFPEGSRGAQVVYRAVAAAASDLAAMAARPLAMTLALTLPTADEDWLADCRRGLTRAVQAFSLPLVGGDVSRGPLTLTVQVLGGVPRGQAIARGGAQPGDVLYVSGALGDAAAGLAILQQRIVVPEPWASRLLKAFWEPSPALALGAQLRGLATAAVDVSDGLLADAGHLAKASGVKLVIDSAALPLSEALRQLPDQEQARNWALAGGEDYCLCFTLPGDAPAPEGCVGIGRVEVGEGVYCDLMPQRVGYRHF